MASLNGVVDEWDGSDVVRQRMRDSQLLLIPLTHFKDVKVNVEVAELNFEALKPLMRRLQDPPGVVGMHSIPALMHQKFSQNL